MKILAIFAALLLFIEPPTAAAASDIQLNEAHISFKLPDTWDAKRQVQGNLKPSMESSDPLMVSWKRSPIVDKDGSMVLAGLNVVAFKVPADSNVVLISARLMAQRGWPRKKFLTVEHDGITLPNSLAYESEFLSGPDRKMKVFIVHAVNGGVFVELMFSATDEIFEKIEPELREALRSLKVS
ncbi:hypothetical protein [Undibacterium flavidum]|uniref:Uncharacterized protein n=1 Tax=Undibacterium flavidum TaxID=2762297 RepID=A0ABR6YHB3_9BURK|nr:hypothetical protein [Undibacterium flavidum]MBC3875970.1 hypothetical protein [Undibacterium flavidum]